jgi:2-methylcitrate dehydratase PrpD
MSAREPTATQRMAAFARELTLRDAPEGVVRLARLHLADAIGVALAASSVPSHRNLLTGLLAQRAETGPAMVLGLRAGAPADVAALLNGMSIHALEYDDTHMGSIMHGSAVIVPVALAMGQQCHLPPCDVLRLTIVGWELLVRLGRAAAGAFQRRGFQATSVAGAIVAAMLAAAARGADAARIASAGGIAGSQASGIFAFLNDGATVKALHPGWAAHAGVWADRLSAAGMTGPLSVLEGRHGVYSAYANDAQAGERLMRELDSLGSAWTLEEAAFKLYPCCHYIHPYLEVAARLRDEAAALGQPIVSVHCRVAPGAGLVIAEPWARKQAPRDAHEAKYSLPYCVAMALLGLPVDVGAMSAATLDARALGLAARIGMSAWEDSGFPERFAADLAVTLADGRVLDARLDQVEGCGERPASINRIREKFLDNAGLAMPPSRAARWWDAILNDEALPVWEGVDARDG